MKPDWKRNLHYLRVVSNKFACTCQATPPPFPTPPHATAWLGSRCIQFRAEWILRAGQIFAASWPGVLPPAASLPLQPSVDERKINSSLHPQWAGLLLLAAPSSRVPITFYYFRYPFAPAAQVFSPPSTWWAFS